MMNFIARIGPNKRKEEEICVETTSKKQLILNFFLFIHIISRIHRFGVAKK